MPKIHTRPGSGPPGHACASWNRGPQRKDDRTPAVACDYATQGFQDPGGSECPPAANGNLLSIHAAPCSVAGGKHDRGEVAYTSPSANPHGAVRLDMLYTSAEQFLEAKRKSLFLFGMSGVGKTRVAGILRHTRGWYHYSVDYRIGTRYLGEHISDSIRQIAMTVPALSRLLRSDSIILRSNLSFANLTPLSEWVGAPGNTDRGGIPFEEYVRRQRLHRDAEVAATLEAERFIARAKIVYGYDLFVCDSSGSVCEIADPDNPEDELFSRISTSMLPVYIRAGEGHREKLQQRFANAPKPMYYNEDFLRSIWSEYRRERVSRILDPVEFLRFGFSRLLDWRLPRYESLARNWAVTLDADRIARIETGEEIEAIVAEAIDGLALERQASV